MVTHGETTNSSINLIVRRVFYRKLRVLLFYVPSTALTLFFLFINISVLGETFVWNSTEDMRLRFHQLPANDVFVGTLLALALTAINLANLTLTTTSVIRAFKGDIWLNEVKMDRLWVTFIIAFVTYLFVGGWLFFAWLDISFKYVDF